MSYLLGLGLFAAVIGGCAMESTDNQPQSDGLSVRSVEHLPEYVIGFPAFVAISVQAPPDTSYSALRFADVVNMRESIGVDVRDANGREVFRYTPTPVIERDFGAAPQRLAAGEVRRMLTDVSPFLASGIAAGTYDVQFAFVTPEEIVRATPIRIRLRTATPDEDDLRARVAADRATMPNWAMWTIVCPATPVSDRDVRAGHPLAFSLMLRSLFCGVSGRNVDIARLDVLTGLYAPEREALKGELYVMRGDRAAYDRLRAATLQSTPGLAWWFRMTDGGGGFIQTFSAASRR